MSSPRSSNRTMIVVLLLLLLLTILFALVQCSRMEAVAIATPAAKPAVAAEAERVPAVASTAQPETLTPATLSFAPRIAAGAALRVTWTGPDNTGDYVTLVRPDAAAALYGNYGETRRGNPLEVLAPMEPGEWEVRYVTARSKTVLGRAALRVDPVGATLSAPDEADLGTTISVAWTGPNNAGDYITIVAAGTPDGRYGNYAQTKTGSPLTLTVPVDAGAAEIRYVAAQGRQVLARRALVVTNPETTLAATSEVVAGSTFEVMWTGPKNPGDYITVVAKGTADGRYANYTEVAKGSPLKLVAPIEAGEAEIRYMTGGQARVLARRALTIVSAVVTLEAVSSAAPGEEVEVRWSGPNNRGDYITLVPEITPDGQYGNYSNASRGSPLKLTAPKGAGRAELRYMSGQGAKVLARRTIEIAAPN